MGCYQSKEQVAETTTPEAPAAEAEAAPAEAPAAEAAEVKTEEAPKEEEAKPAEEAAPAAAPEAEKPAEEAPKEEEAKAEEPKAEEPKDKPEEAKPEAEAPKEEAADPAKEPETEAKPAEEPEADPVVKFESTGVKYGDQNIAFYTYKGVNQDDPTKEYELCKRYNDFKALREALVPVWGTKGKPLPDLPHGGVFTFIRGRKSKGIAAQRETAFLDLLHAVSRNPAAFESEAFQKFIAA